jgi:phosphopantothenoylcysteine decarboxylase/phosphopantothenate--cysteine ligase
MIAIHAYRKALNTMSPTILITAGATREQIDPVRFIGNRSSGHLGCQLALASAVAGFETTLLLGSGSESATCHPRLKTHIFTSTRDLEALIHQHWPSKQYLIMAAAVSDFTPRGGSSQEKITRTANMTLELVPTHDLVANASKEMREDQKIIAFALGDTKTLEQIATQKLERKGVDAIVANPLPTMDAPNITATVYCKDGRTFSPVPNCSKSNFANWIIKHLDDICSTPLSS